MHGKSFGTVTLVVWSKTGQRNFYNITVEQNLEPLRKLLKETFPNEDIHVQSSRDSLSLTGRVTNKEVRRPGHRAGRAVRQDHRQQLQIAEAPVERQILLRVKFAELDRSASNQFARKPAFHRRHQHDRAKSPRARSVPRLLTSRYGAGPANYLSRLPTR